MTTLNAPAGIAIYGGVGSFTARSADGSIYVVYCGERPGAKFGTHIYRVLTNGQTEWIEYTPFTEGRVECTVEPDGLYISFGVNRERQPERVKIPGFVTPAYPGGTQSFPPGPVTVSNTDSAARASATAAQKAADAAAAKIKQLEATIKKLETRLAAQEKSGGGQLTESEILDRIWTKSNDRFYAELSNPNSPVSNLIREYAKGLR